MAEFQSQGRWGARDFDKYVFNAPIPAFDESNALHQELAEAAEQAEEAAKREATEEGDHFIRTRTRIRDALAKHGIAKKIEGLAGSLLCEE